MKQNPNTNNSNKLTLLRKRQYARIIVATATLMSAAVLARANMEARGLESNLTQAIYNLPLGLLYPALVLTQLGSAWFALFMIAVLALKNKYRLALRLSIGVLLAYASAELLKLVVARSRPPGLLTSIVSREPLTFSYGFPSGHTAVIVTLFILLRPLMSAMAQKAALGLVIIVPLTRMYLGVHLPLDIIGGACIGVIAATLIRMIRSILPGIRSR